jgi:hypothetical protein
MDPSYRDAIPLCKILYLRQRHRTTGGIKHNRSESGRGAWVALSFYPTHSNTDNKCPSLYLSRENVLLVAVS